MKGHLFHVLILVVTIRQYPSSFLCRFDRKSKRNIPTPTQDDPHSNTGNRVMRSSSQNSEQMADLALIIDTSGSVQGETFEKLKRNLRGLTKSNAIDIGRDKVRLAIITFATHAHKILGFDEGVTRDTVIKAIDRIPTGGGTNIADGFNKAKEEFIKAKDRRGIPKAAILISDGDETCKPDQIFNGPNCAKEYMDCNFMLGHCPTPPASGYMCDWVYGAVFTQFDELKKAGGSSSNYVTLAVIGVGRFIDSGRDRLKCWATEQLYMELPTYDKLKETIEALVIRIVPKDSRKDCECTYIAKEKCGVHNGKCGHYIYINITRHASSTGHPCPKEKKKWFFCRYSDCNLTVPRHHNRIEPQVVRPTKPPDVSTGIAWWSIFVILLGVVVFVLLVAILMVVVLRRRRVRRAITAGAQPSAMDPLTIKTGKYKTKMQLGSSASYQAHKASPRSAGTVGQNIQHSAVGVSRSAQPSSTFLKNNQYPTAPIKSGSYAFAKSMPSNTLHKPSQTIQSGEGYKPTSASKWKIPSKTAFQKT